LVPALYFWLLCEVLSYAMSLMYLAVFIIIIIII
jgi:hypothetical protein